MIKTVTELNDVKVGDSFYFKNSSYDGCSSQKVFVEEVPPKKVLIGGTYYRYVTADAIKGIRMIKTVTELNDVKVGDSFYFKNSSYDGCSFQKVFVEEVTPKKVLIGGTYYRKADASMIGKMGSYTDKNTLYYESDEILKVNMLRDARNAISRIDWKKAGDDFVLDVYEVYKRIG